jgi:hypothetical protein
LFRLSSLPICSSLQTEKKDKKIREEDRRRKEKERRRIQSFKLGKERKRKKFEINKYRG